MLGNTPACECVCDGLCMSQVENSVQVRVVNCLRVPREFSDKVPSDAVGDGNHEPHCIACEGSMEMPYHSESIIL